MKQEKGIGHIMTILLILVILFFVVGAFYIFHKQYNKENIETIKTDMLALQGKINIVQQEHMINEEEYPLLGETLEGKEEEEWVKALLDEKVIVQTKGVYKISNEELQQMELPNLKLEEQEYFLVEYENKEIYYYKQNLDGNYKMYQLSELVENENIPKILEENEAEENVEEGN